MLSSHGGDGAAGATWPRRDVDTESRAATILPSHSDDGATRATWPQCDVDVELHWRQCY
jgi:hypothetical protein